jgi:hypothetical protein
MIRPFTFLCLTAACGSGLYLYSEKHRAELLDRQIGHVIRATEATRQTTGLLRAEWEVLNNPDRLRPMAQKYLNLTPLLPGQWVQLADLAARLPPPAPPGQSGGTDDGATAVSDATPAETPAAADTPIVAAPANPGIDETPPVPPKPPAPAHPAPIRPAAKLVAHASPKKSPPAALADGEPPLHTNPLAHSAPLALATPQPARARVLSAMARPVRMMQPAVVTAVPSALGVRTAVPPAVPMGAE